LEPQGPVVVGKSPEFAGLQGLLALSERDGVDIRPTLLLVLTDQYVQDASHTPDEERHYTKLALGLIEEVDTATRAALGKRLAAYPRAPRAVLDRLQREMIEPEEELAPLLFEGQQRIFERPDEPDGPIRAARPAEKPTPQAEAAELCELFFAAGAPERRLILLNLDYAPLAAFPLPATLQRADIWRLESAALQHQTETVVRELQRALGVSQEQARRIINDEWGEPVVVAAKAMHLPADVLQRMLLFMNPAVGQSVDRVYALAALFGEITEDAARRMVSIWRNADLAQPAMKQHEPTPWRQAAENARRALSEIPTRASPGPTPAQRSRDVLGTR
jgi:hypothetical protein